MSLRKSAKAIAEKVAPRALQAYRMRKALPSERELLLLPILCSRDKISIDVGANRGLYIHYMLPVSRRVVAFEPIPRLAEKLRLLYPDGVTVENVALSDKPGSATLRVPGGNTSWASIETRNDFSLASPDWEIQEISVALKTLDGFSFTGVGLLKVDVEGHEEAALRGGLQMLSREQPNIVVEVEERHAPGSVHRIRSLLEEIGYDGFFVDEGSLSPVSEFDLVRDQDTANVQVVGKVGRYVNNFVFVPHRQSVAFVQQGNAILAQAR